ncbi:FabD/lysophospholipase-like protein [Lichtheimia hyalospora FSU 10163]|nr:FabD/lysophospholipase-like protein [Lichtheimia hyalospora FSU 10163]
MMHVPTIPSMTVKLPSTEEINEKIAELYPSFTNQFEYLKQSYAYLWDFLSMEDFRHMMTEMEKEASDVKAYPEVAEDAHVRMGVSLSEDEQAFLQARKAHQREAFANFIGVPISQVEIQDIPVTGIATSGGGYRAMVGSAGYLKAMKDTGVLDTVTYLAGVSGSCWGLAQLYSPLTDTNFDTMKDHLKSHVHTHLANMNNFISILHAAPQNGKILMQGIIERYYQQNGDINLVDIFGMMLGGTLLTRKKTISEEEKDDSTLQEPDGTLIKPLLLDRKTMKLSNQRKYIEDGSLPMPIYCVVRHDIESDPDEGDVYQWFEFTPFEMGSEEINAWIPVWAFGRKFEQGKNIERLPEQTMGIMMGVFGSAFAASLSHFYQEIRSFVPSSALEKADGLLLQYRDSMSVYHPISPAWFPNPFYQLHVQAWTPVIDRLISSKKLCLADAGLDNNIPFYPLLRKGRDVDVIFAIDLSADIQTAPHFERAEGYVRRRGIEGWPMGAGWPKDNEQGLGTCTVFASEATEKPEQHTTSNMNPDHHPVTLIYFPLISNPNYDPEFDPQTAEFCSTWNFVYSPGQVQQLMDLAETNFNDNVDHVRQVLRKVWERKRDQRLARERAISEQQIAQIA